MGSLLLQEDRHKLIDVKKTQTSVSMQSLVRNNVWGAARSLRA